MKTGPPQCRPALATIVGYQRVVPKDTFKVGDSVVYIEFKMARVQNGYTIQLNF